MSQAQTIKQRIRNLAVNIFRIRSKEVVAMEILDRVRRDGFQVRGLDSRRMEIVSAQQDHYILRKRSSDIYVFNQVILDEEYSPLLALVTKYSTVTAIHCIVDAGANVGMTSLYFRKAFPMATILAVEPSPENFLALKQNAERNSMSSVKLFKNALWTANDKMSVVNTFRDRQQWALQVTADPKGDVQALTLQAILESAGFTAADIIKIDVEGAEKKLLADPDFLKQLSRSKFIAIELHEEAIDKIEAIHILERLGFELTIKGETLFGVNRAAL